MKKFCSKAAEKYCTACIRFAEDTHDWSDLVYNKFYTTGGDVYWQETCDNAHGGIDVSWAFHKTPEQIEASAAEVLLDEIVSRIEQAVDEEWDISSIQHLIIDII